jgi:aminopeptidase
MDPRIKETAKILVEYSNKIKKGDLVIINGGIEAQNLIKEVYKLCVQRGAYPRLNIGLPGLNKIYFDNASQEQLEHFPTLSMHEAKKADVFISQKTLGYFLLPH